MTDISEFEKDLYWRKFTTFLEYIAFVSEKEGEELRQRQDEVKQILSRSKEILSD
jgi:hypothetical protein